MPAGDVFGLDGFFLNKSNPVVVSTIGINSTGSSAGIAVTGGSFSAGTVTLTFQRGAAGLTTTPFYTGAKIAVSGLSTASGVAHTGYNGNFVVTGFAGTTTVSYATTGYIGPVNASIAGQTGLVVLLTDTQVNNTTWSSAQTHGWFAGGGAPVISRVDRIDFSNDSVTANIRGPLGAAKYVLAATGNSNYGWFGGGLTITPIMVSSVDRIDFSNDSSAVSVRGPLSFARQLMAAAGNSNYGFFGGGANFPATISYSRVDRIDFSNDSSTASTRGPLSGVRYTPGATGNSNYSWFGGGIDIAAATRSTVDRIDFSNDSSTASVRGPLGATKHSLVATGNSNYGWFGGGNSNGSRVERIDFSNDSVTASVRGPLTVARSRLGATGNSNYGWFGGGAAGALSSVDRIDFSNDSSTATPRGPLSVGRQWVTSTSGQAKGPAIKLQKAGNFGWFSVAGPATATVNRIDFSNDSSTASVRGPLSLARNGLAATGNSNYGWFGGGYTGANGQRTLVDRIDFSNDSPTASVRGSLIIEKQNLAATGNSNYGWFGGGTGIPLGAPPTQTLNRIDFSNDSPTASVRGPLSSVRTRLAATGNSNYGWFGGGLPSSAPPTTISTVERIDFSNDGVTVSPRGPLSSAKQRLAATGNSNYGWFGGGNTGGFPSPQVATVDRIDFSNDSSTASVRGPLSSARGYALAATGNSNYGWFGGGNNPAVATVDRIDFSNDSSTASVRGPLSAARSYLAATSNTPVG
jgi:hypothetical protein